MAWNQPGGNGGDKDPWGSRGGQQGPPDLDEALRKLQVQLGRIFGGKGKGGSGGGGGLGGLGGVGIGIIAVLLVGVWVFLGFYIVDPAEQGVELRFGEHVDTTGPGLHWVAPFIETVEKVNVQQNRSAEIGFRRGSTGSVAHESLMLTEDENIIDIKLAVQYRVKDAAAYLFHVDDPQTTLKQATESALREVVGRTGMDFVLTEGRDVVASEAGTLTQEILDQYRVGLQLISANMQDAQPPAQVQDAFDDAVRAREDQVRIINLARAYQAKVVPEARGESQAIRQRADAYRQRVIAQAEGETSRFSQVLAEYRQAPAITRKRLYLEAIESVLANSRKVLVDVDSGNNMMLFPLDRLVGAGVAGAMPSTPSMGTSELGSTTSSFASDRRSRDAASGRTR